MEMIGMRCLASAVLGVLIMVLGSDAMAEGESCGHRALYFTKSAGYEHSVVKRDGDRLSHSERILTGAFAQHGVELICTKDGGMITADNLKNFDTVLSYTSGDLLQAGTDKFPAISQEGFSQLLEWIRRGGGFLGIHASTDSNRAAEPTEYTKLIGGAFASHGQQEYASVKVVDPGFPAMRGLPLEFRMIDEWYVHNQVNAAGNMRVLMTLETGKMEQEMYNKVPLMPITWCSNYGKGRVFYTALGHREDVWEMPLVQGILLKAYEWTSGQVSGDATPNFGEIIK